MPVTSQYSIFAFVSTLCNMSINNKPLAFQLFFHIFYFKASSCFFFIFFCFFIFFFLSNVSNVSVHESSYIQGLCTLAHASSIQMLQTFANTSPRVSAYYFTQRPIYLPTCLSLSVFLGACKCHRRLSFVIRVLEKQWESKHVMCQLSNFEQ